MAVEVTDMDLTTLMVTTLLVHLIGVVHNHRVTTKEIMPINTNHIVHGVQVEMVPSTEGVVLEDVKESW